MSVGSRPLVPSRLAPGGIAHGGRATATSKVGAYIALTKPRIIELLLITTVPTMVLAEGGWPSTWLVIVTLIGGTLAAGGANAINMYVDRDIDRLMVRTRNRPLVTGVIAPRDALVFAVALGDRRLRRAVGRRQPAVGRARALGDGLLRRRLHDLAEAHEHAEHRDRRRRRRGAGARRLGRRPERPELDAGRAVRRDVLLDAAPLLGARDPLRRRLPRRQRADAARRRAARARRAPDDRPHGGDGGLQPAARPGRRPRADLRRRRRRARRDLRRRHGVAEPQPDPGQLDARVRRTRSRTSRCCSGR